MPVVARGGRMKLDVRNPPIPAIRERVSSVRSEPLVQCDLLQTGHRQPARVDPWNALFALSKFRAAANTGVLRLWLQSKRV